MVARPADFGPASILSDDVGVLPVPDHTSESAKAVAIISTGRLISGDTIDFALFKVAAGCDFVVRVLDTLGITMSRQTVKRALKELVDLGVLDRVGQLDPWMDRRAEGGAMRKVGAYVYSLAVTCRTLGDRALSTLRRGSSGLAGASSPSKCHVRTTGHGSRVDGCLAAAIRLAHAGIRNVIGHWLTCRCTEAGLPEGETMGVMRVYVRNVPQSPPYTMQEAERTVRSCYRRRRSYPAPR